MHLIQLPGLDGTGALFAGFVAALDERFEPLVVSYPVDEPLGYAEVERLVRERLPQEPFVLLAESFSGPLGISIAAEPPTGLRALVLCCSFARNPWPVLKPLRFFLPAVPGWALRSWLARRLLLGRWSSGELSIEMARAMGHVSLDVLRQRLRAVAEVDVRARLARVRVPLLYLQATEDRIVPRRALAEIASVNHALERSEIQGPHLLLQARPRECASALTRFVFH